MEAYYKARRKKINLYTRQLKKLKGTGTKEQIREIQAAYRNVILETPSREKYMSEDAYLKELKRSVRDVQEPFLTLKLDLCYDLEVGLEEYDKQEKEVLSLKKTQDMLLKQKQAREHQSKEEARREREQYKGKVDSFLYLEKADQMKLYTELEEQARALANPHRQVMAYEIANKELEYRLTQLYDPLVEVKIKG